MSSLVLDEQVMDRLRERNPRYRETAYVFLISALHFVLQRLDETRHITGRELTEGVRDLAIDRFGPMARTVLEHWGIRDTTDVGEIVFALVECGILIKQDDDCIDDFLGVYDFEEVFERDYPWGASI
jgi:uncharacterized repeat protein (TIGR04138 family)